MGEQVNQLNRSLTVDVLQRVATREGVDETALPPISDVVDTDALDALFARQWAELAPVEGHVEFDYCGYTVHVDADRSITLHKEPHVPG